MTSTPRMEAYSTLEVNNDNPQSRQDEHPQPPQAAPIEFASLTTSPDHHKERVVPAEEIYPQSSPWQDPNGHATSQEAQITGHGNINGNEPERKILGFRRRKFWAILIIVVVVITAAVAGGVAGGLSSRSNSSNASGAGDWDNILRSSKITASNFTDTQGNNHRIVIFQDAYSSVVARRWDSKSNAWYTSNISLIMTRASAGFDPWPGTALACASRGPESADQKVVNRVWYLDKRNIIRVVRCDSPGDTPDAWRTDEWHVGDDVIEVQNNSQLAVAWQNTAKQGTNWAIAYQEVDEGAINVCNDTQITTVVGGAATLAGTNLAIAPLAGGNQTEDLEMLFETVGGVNDTTTEMSSYVDKNWKHSDEKLQAPMRIRSLAITKWDGDNTMHLSLLTDGTVIANVYSGSELIHSAVRVEFNGGPSSLVNFSAVATTLDSRLYGIVDDKLLEYELDTSLTAAFNYVGTVFP